MVFGPLGWCAGYVFIRVCLFCPAGVWRVGGKEGVGDGDGDGDGREAWISRTDCECCQRRCEQSEIENAMIVSSIRRGVVGTAFCQVVSRVWLVGAQNRLGISGKTEFLLTCH